MESSTNRNVGMNMLQRVYKEGQFTFKNDDEWCRDYEIKLNKDDDPDKFEYLDAVLKSHLPIRRELTLPENHSGAYSTFEGSPMSEGVLHLIYGR